MHDDDPRTVPDRVAPVAGTLARDDWPVLVGLPAVASLFVFAVPALGWWALGAAVVVYAAGFLGFERARATEATYRRLAETLGSVPELSGAMPNGHAERTAALAADMARALDLTPAQLVMVEDAARCRNIGRVGGQGARDVDPQASRHNAARRSAAIVARAGRLARVSPLIAPEPPLAGAPARMRAIVDTAAAFDEALSVNGGDPVEAVRAVRDSGRADVVGALAASVGVTNG